LIRSSSIMTSIIESLTGSRLASSIHSEHPQEEHLPNLFLEHIRRIQARVRQEGGCLARTSWGVRVYSTPPNALWPTSSGSSWSILPPSWSRDLLSCCSVEYYVFSRCWQWKNVLLLVS
jgi:hypothetical protein